MWKQDIHHLKQVNPDFNLQTGIANPVEEWGKWRMKIWD